MKFVRDAQGRLVPEDEWMLKAELEKLRHGLLTMEPISRASFADRLRWSAASIGHEFSAEDERVLAAYIEGVLDYRHVIDHFGAWARNVGIPGRS